MLCAELRLGRDDQASPYEISKVFDGIAGALRPGIIRRPPIGPPTLTLRIVSEGGARSVRFLVQAPAIYHPAIAARLRATYPDTRLIPIDASHADPFALSTVVSPGAAIRALLGRREPVAPVPVDMLRVKKARRWVWALATTKDYEHSVIESLLSVMHALSTPCVVELLLTPAPTLLERYTGHALVRRERRFIADRALGPNEPGADGVVAKKHLQGAVEGIGRAWWWFDLRVIVPRGHEPHARQVAGVIQETRGENYLRVRVMRLRRRLYAWRSGRGLAPLFPALWSGALSSAEVASLWHLPTLRLKGVPLRRISAREIAATSAISRDPAHAVMHDEHGPVGIHPADRRYGWMLLGTAGAGKTAALAPHVKAVAEDDERALVIIDPKEDFARVCMGLIPTRRTVHYLDLGAPRYGLNILTAGHLTPEIRADIFISVIRELAGESSVGPRSDLFLRAALQAVMIVEPVPALQHVAALLDPYDDGYREWVTRELRSHHEIDFVRDYWDHTFPHMVKHNPRFFAEAVAAPANKIARFLTSPSLNLLMTHSIQLDLERIIQRREILIVNGSKGAVGESNANLFCSMLILLIQRALHQMQRVEARGARAGRPGHRRGTQRLHPGLLHATGRGPLRRHRGRRSLPIHRPNRRRKRQGRGQKPAAERLDLPPARLPGRAGGRGACDGSLPGQHPRRHRGPAPNPNRPDGYRAAAELPQRQPVAGARRSAAGGHGEHGADGAARCGPRGDPCGRAPRA